MVIYHKYEQHQTIRHLEIAHINSVFTRLSTTNIARDVIVSYADLLLGNKTKLHESLLAVKVRAV
jgi:hypothetical protein